jgi:hypothetical protein
MEGSPADPATGVVGSAASAGSRGSRASASSPSPASGSPPVPSSGAPPSAGSSEPASPSTVASSSDTSQAASASATTSTSTGRHGLQTLHPLISGPLIARLIVRSSHCRARSDVRARGGVFALWTARCAAGRRRGVSGADARAGFGCRPTGTTSTSATAEAEYTPLPWSDTPPPL